MATVRLERRAGVLEQSPLEERRDELLGPFVELGAPHAAERRLYGRGFEVAAVAPPGEARDRRQHPHQARDARRVAPQKPGEIRPERVAACQRAVEIEDRESARGRDGRVGPLRRSALCQAAGPVAAS